MLEFGKTNEFSDNTEIINTSAIVKVVKTFSLISCLSFNIDWCVSLTHSLNATLTWKHNSTKQSIHCMYVTFVFILRLSFNRLPFVCLKIYLPTLTESGTLHTYKFIYFHSLCLSYPNWDQHTLHPFSVSFNKYYILLDAGWYRCCLFFLLLYISTI